MSTVTNTGAQTPEAPAGALLRRSGRGAVSPGRYRPGQRTLGKAKPLAANTGCGGVSAHFSLLATRVFSPRGQLPGVSGGAGVFLEIPR